MSKYKKMASEGNFSANQLQVPNEVPKIVEQTQRKVAALKENANFELKNREIYLRAQQFAQQQEELNRKQNFKLETENRQAFIDVERRNMDTKLKENEAQAKRQAKVFTDLAAFAPTATQLVSAIDQKMLSDRKKAANVLVDKHGITADRMQQIYAVEDGLTKSQFNNIAWMQELQGSDVTEEAKAAFFEIYKNRGSRAYTNVTAVLQNSAHTAETRLEEYLHNLRVENPQITNQELLDATEKWRREEVSNLNYGGKTYTPEMIGKHYSPVANKGINRTKTRLQRQLNTDRDDAIKLDRVRAYSVAFENEGVVGLGNINSTLRSGSERKELVGFLINDSKSGRQGATTVGDMQAFLNLPVPGMGGKTFEQQFPEEAALINDQIRAVQRRERADSNASYLDFQMGIQFEVAEFAESAASDGVITAEELETAERIAMKAGPGVPNPVLEELKKNSQYSLAEKQITIDLTRRKAKGILTGEYVLSLGLPSEIEAKWLSQAKVSDDYRKSPANEAVNIEIKAKLTSQPKIKPSPDGKYNDSVINMAAYYTRQKDELFETLVSQGTPAQQAQDLAIATTLQLIDKQLQSETFIKDGRYVIGDQRNLNEAREAQKILYRKNQVEKFRLLNPRDQKPENIVASLDQPNYRKYIDQMEATGEVPVEVKAHAEIMRLTPLEWVNYIAPALGKEPIEMKSNSWESVVKDLPLVDKNLFTVNPSNPRYQRGMHIRNRTLGAAPVRGRTVPEHVKADTHFMNGVSNIAAKYNINENDLLRLISFESAGTFDPSIRNRAGSGATGLIQFTDATARGLGTTTEALARMSRTEQLQYVDKYLSDKGIEGKGFDDLYMAILFPAAVGKSNDFVLFGQGATYPGFGAGSRAYSQNSGLDTNRDGSITKAEAAAKAK